MLRRNAREMEVEEIKRNRYREYMTGTHEACTREMYKEARRIRMVVSGAATYDFIGCLPLRCLDESKDMIF